MRSSLVSQSRPIRWLALALALVCSQDLERASEAGQTSSHDYSRGCIETGEPNQSSPLWTFRRIHV